MNHLLVLQWGQVSQQIDVTGGQPASALLKGRIASGSVKPSVARASSKKNRASRTGKATCRGSR